ncbi:hypothetical protein [Desulfovibrio sp.]
MLPAALRGLVLPAALRGLVRPPAENPLLRHMPASCLVNGIAPRANGVAG